MFRMNKMIVFLKEPCWYLLYFTENSMNSQPILGDGMKSKDAFKAPNPSLESSLWLCKCVLIRSRIIQMMLFKIRLLSLLYCTSQDKSDFIKSVGRNVGINFSSREYRTIPAYQLSIIIWVNKWAERWKWTLWNDE